MRPPFPASTRGAIHRALPCFGERTLPEGNDGGRLSVGMVGSGRGRRDQGLCELGRDYNDPPRASVFVSYAALQAGSGSPGTPVGSSPPAAHRRRLPWAPAPEFLVFVHPSRPQPGPSVSKRYCPGRGSETGTDVPPSALRGT